jgi:hypothetical protein
MPDFDANDDQPRLSAPGMDDSIDLPRLTARFAPRMRQLAERRCFTRPAPRELRLRPVLMARRRDAARNACGARMAPPRRRRRLRMKCHRQSPGHVS